MKYKAYVFDIDGTILQNGEAAPNMALQNAINALQQNGAIIIIATGRALFSAKAVLGTIKPDYFISTNGAYITNKSDKMIFAQYMTSQEMYALVDFCDDYELPLSFTFNDGYYIYTETERYISEYGDNAECTEFMRDGTERVRHLIDMPYGACLCAKNGKADEFNAKYAHLALNLVPFGSNDYYDVFPNSVNKAIGTQKLLDTLS
ncbi:MAG: HAD family hydrolase, partial [Oscillospiraceae bacterium]